MKQDHKGHVIKLASFLGYKLSDKQVDLVVEKSSFNAMATKDKESSKDSESKGWRADRSAFVRKGIIGDWVNHYSEEQSNYIDEMSKKYLEPLGITFDLWNHLWSMKIINN